METLRGILSEHAFFKDFPARHLELIVGCASNVCFDAETFIFHEGEAAEKFFLIREGKVALQITSERRGALNIQTLGPGEILGWSWLLPPYLWKLAAKVIDPTRALAIDGHCLRDKAAQDHDLGYELLIRFSRVFVKRLESIRLQLANVYEDKLHQPFVERAGFSQMAMPAVAAPTICVAVSHTQRSKRARWCSMEVPADEM